MSSTPTSNGDMTVSTSGVVCPAEPATGLFRLTTRLGQLCGFWSRDADDALTQTASLVAAGFDVPRRVLDPAIALLLANGEMGALRLAGHLKKVIREQVDEPVVLRGLPEDVIPRLGKNVRGCAYIVEPFSKLRCRNRGIYNVVGSQRCFCDLHARRVSTANACRAELAQKKAARKKR